MKKFIILKIPIPFSLTEDAISIVLSALRSTSSKVLSFIYLAPFFCFLEYIHQYL